MARIFNFEEKPSAPIFSIRAGSCSWWISSNTTTGFAQERKNTGGSRTMSSTVGRSQLT